MIAEAERLTLKSHASRQTFQPRVVRVRKAGAQRRRERAEDAMFIANLLELNERSKVLESLVVTQQEERARTARAMKAKDDQEFTYLVELEEREEAFKALVEKQHTEQERNKNRLSPEEEAEFAALLRQEKQEKKAKASSKKKKKPGNVSLVNLETGFRAWMDDKRRQAAEEIEQAKILARNTGTQLLGAMKALEKELGMPLIQTEVRAHDALFLTTTIPTGHDHVTALTPASVRGDMMDSGSIYEAFMEKKIANEPPVMFGVHVLPDISERQKWELPLGRTVFIVPVHSFPKFHPEHPKSPAIQDQIEAITSTVRREALKGNIMLPALPKKELA